MILKITKKKKKKINFTQGNSRYLIFHIFIPHGFLPSIAFIICPLQQIFFVFAFKIFFLPILKKKKSFLKKNFQ